MTVQEWVDAYALAWRDRDADAAASLFADDCLYREHPLQEPFRGAEGVRSYWATATATQERVDVQMGRPVESSVGRSARSFRRSPRASSRTRASFTSS